MYTTRRDFLTGSLTLLSAASTLPLFLGRTVQALAASSEGRRPRGDEQRILVVVQLAGGNDGLNTVIPVEADEYYRARPVLAIPKKRALRIKDGLGLHPAASGLKDLFDEGLVAVVQGVGYPNPNRSHFTSTDIWQTADPKLRRRSGWIGRYFDAACKGCDPPDPIKGVALTKEAPRALQGERFMPLAFDNPDMLTWRPGQRVPEAQTVFEHLNNVGQAPPSAQRPLQQFLQRAALKALIGAEQIRSAAARSLRTRGRGQRLGETLSLVARMILADLPTRVYYVSMGGFDTHTSQVGRHERLMRELGDAMRGFIATLRVNKVLDRVLVMTFSEFGRRVQENASGGTDHGEAAPMFLFGSRLRPGVHNRHPDLKKLHRGDLAYVCDFRRVYAAVLRDWLNASPEPILGGRYAPLRVVHT